MFKQAFVFLLLFVLPLVAAAQDTLRLPPDYQPYYNWYELPDSAVIALKDEYPERWQKDSLYYVLLNVQFKDSLFSDSSLKARLMFARIADSTLQTASYSDMPPANGRLKKRLVPYWVYWVVLLVVLGIVFLKFANLRLFNMLFLSFISPKYCEEALREHDTPINIYNLVATLICSLSYSLILWFAVIKTGVLIIHPNLLVSFLLLFMAIAIFYLLRYLFIMLFAAVLDAERTYGTLVQVTVSGNIWLALILIPAFALVNATYFHYSPPDMFIYAVLALLIFLIIKQVRVFIQVLNTFPHSIIYLILYLCALEIAPYLAIFKVVIQQTG